jgi:hypothetical protein
VIQLKDALQRYGVAVWLDRDEIRPGDLFVKALETGLEQSRAVALIVSPEAIASGWVEEEYARAMSLAQHKQRPLQLILVLLRDATVPSFLQSRHRVDFRDERAYAQKVWELAWGITGRKPPEILDLTAPAASPDVRDHRVTTRSRRRSWRLGSLALPTFSFGSDLLSPVYNVSPAGPGQPAAHSVARIFLCHAKEDKSQVRDIYQRLKAEGFSPWLDEQDIFPGQLWDQEIREAMRASDFIMIFFSKTSVAKRGYVQREMKLALDLLEEIPTGQIYTIPSRLDDCQIPDQFSKFQWVDLFGKGGFERLVQAIRHGIEQRQIP